MLAIVKAYKTGLLKKENWQRNIIAGLVVGIVALPLAMAFAIASGLKPEQGLYTAIIAGSLVALFGGTQVQVAGPTGAFVVILAGITAKYGVIGLQIATILAGIILLIMGFLKLGNAIKFIPYPVIVGFTSGIGVIIFINSWKDFFGLPVSIPLDAEFHEKILILFKALGSLNIVTTRLGLLSLFCIVFIPHFIKQIPGPLIALIVVTGLQMVYGFSIATIGSVFGNIPQQLPAFSFPDISQVAIIPLIGPAFTIALLSGIESLLSATAADAIIGSKHDANQELIGHGLANFFAPFWSGFASTGAIARTVTNIRYGGNSPIAALIHALVLILIILIFAPLAVYIPFCALAAILFVVAYNMSDIPEFIHLLKHAPYYDRIILVITFLLTIFIDLVVAVGVGVILGMLFFTLRMYQSINIGQMQPETSETHSGTKEILIYDLNGPFFFGAAEKIEQALSITHTDPKAIIFNFKNVPFIDMTGIETFANIIKQYKKRSVIVYICQANDIVMHKLEIIPELHKNSKIFFNTIDAAINFYKKK